MSKRRGKVQDHQPKQPTVIVCDAKASFKTRSKAKKWAKRKHDPNNPLDLVAYNCPHCGKSLDGD